MKIYNSLNNLPDNHKLSSVTIGNFDGIHEGHIKLLKNTIALAKEHNTTPVVLTFNPMPEEYFQKKDFFRLMDNETKIRFFEEYGIEQTIFIDFNKSFSQITDKGFIDNILIEKLNAKHIIIGSDFKFGHKRVGDVNLLKSYGGDKGIEIKTINLVEVCNQKISSSSIRELLKIGKFSDANNFLGKPFSIDGEVVHGEKLGRELGYPTANIELCKSYPINGIFLVEVLFKNSEKLYGLASIGNKPTFSGTNDVLEVYIFNFDCDIYGKTIEVVFLEKIRDQVKYNSKEELVNQIKKDHITALNILRNKK